MTNAAHPLLNKTLLLLVVLMFIFCALFSFIVFKNNQQFVYLSQSFLRGKLYFLEEPGSWIDSIFFRKLHYWHLGPLPSVILLPFVALANAFHTNMQQGYLHFFVVMGTFLLLYKLSRSFKATHPSALYWAYAFCFSSAFMGVALWPWSWFFSQALATLFVLWSFYSFLVKKRYITAGMAFGFALATRMQLLPLLLFFMLTLLSKKASLKAFFQFLFPVLILGTMLLLYNYARFGNAFETGIVTHQVMQEGPLVEAKKHGFFSFTHVPTNLYYSLLAAPTPVVYKDGSNVLAFPFITPNLLGMSIFITGPYLLKIFTLKRLDRQDVILIITVALVALPSLLYFSSGYREFGYRYSLDYLPLLHILLMKNSIESKKELSVGYKLIIILSSLFNLYLFLTMFLTQ